MAAQPDFWGEIGAGEIRSPVSILREQAALLASKTNYQVTAKVDTSTFYGKFTHAFELVVPALDYVYQLFAIDHDVNLFPVKVHAEAVELKNEDEFRQWLQQKLSSPETRKIIQNLLSQVA